MKESLELRVNIEFADLVFPKDIGKNVGSVIVRNYTFLPNDIIMAKIKRVTEELIKKQNRSFFLVGNTTEHTVIRSIKKLNYFN